MKAQVCPVCKGRGKVPLGFYEPELMEPGRSVTIDPVRTWVPCRACGGKGYIIIPEEAEDKMEPPKPMDVWWTETARIEVKWEG